MTKEIIIIAAPETYRGETDYTVALVEQLIAFREEHPVLAYKKGYMQTMLFLKAPLPGADIPEELTRHSDIGVYPTDKRTYSHIPYYSDSTAEKLTKYGPHDAIIFGAGHSTLDTLISLKKGLEEKGSTIEAAYITHQADSKERHTTRKNRTTLVLPESTAGSDEYAHNIDSITGDSSTFVLNSVLHTNTAASCQAHAHLFWSSSYTDGLPSDHTRHAQNTLKDWIENEKKFAIAVVNAGYDSDGKRVHYTKEEAYKHGYALGQKMAKGTHLYCLEGGPRNRGDYTEDGTPPESFMAGYITAQGGDETLCLFEPCIDNSPYNPVKVATVLANDPSCCAFISNAEGFGTMAGACALIDNTHKNFLLGAFMFDALKQDPAKMENVDAYDKKGMKIMSVDDDMKISWKKIRRGKTPVIEKEAARQLLEHFHLIPTEDEIAQYYEAVHAQKNAPRPPQP